MGWEGKGERRKILHSYFLLIKILQVFCRIAGVIGFFIVRQRKDGSSMAEL